LQDPVAPHSSSRPTVSSAWLNLAYKIEKLIESSDDAEVLNLLSAGAYLKAIELFSKTIAIALACSISSENQQKILESIKDGIIDGNVDFLDMKFSIDHDISNDRILSALFTGKDTRIINSVTSYGWLTIAVTLGGILGSLPGTASPIKGSGFLREDLITKCSSSLKILNSVIVGNEYPYLSIKDATEKLNTAKLQEILKTNIELAAYFGITFNIQKSSSFILPGGKSVRPKIQLGAKSTSLNLHSILVQRLKGEIAQTPLATAGMDEDNVDIHIWEEIYYQKKLAGISVWSEPFADYANIEHKPQFNKESKDKEIGSRISDAPKEAVIRESSRELDPFIGTEDTDTINKLVETSASDINKTTEKEKPNTLLDELQTIQKKAWGYRSKKSSQSHIRIALLQMIVDDSYRHPILEDISSISKNNGANTQAKKEGSIVKSHKEYRRQTIIENALNACESFGVDVVVLPEYSTRPETVLFICKYLQDRDSNMTIWAGTCRIPKGYAPMGESPFKLEKWTSVLPVVHRTGGGYKVDTSRRKRYGSIAAYEWFNPLGNESLKPVSDVLGWNATTDLKAYCTELICAESFMLNPANLPSLAEYRKKMLSQLGITTSIDTETMVSNDLTAFSRSVSLTRPENSGIHRKSIVLIPAYTNRATDFALTGQSSYLSAGLVSVLCNAVGHGAHGRSCFIGDSCWDYEKDQSLYEQRMGPYHGVFPGLYRQNIQEKGHGALGVKEQAVVIADIDPINTIPGNPRQQTLLSPMEIVAHLPIIEYNANNEDKIDEVVDSVIKCLKSSESIEKISAVSDNLSKIAKLEGQKEEDSWLHKRHYAYKGNYQQLPTPSPLPCLVDWIPVKIEKSELKEIFAPAYSMFGSDELKPDSGGLKPVSDELKPVSDELKPDSDELKPDSDSSLEKECGGVRNKSIDHQ
ncbi:MAG: hypothetical protein PHS31_05625, partial [Victivallaceae bacterium]|nr:hypothetical protein [Victivallaceae bacterium]